MLWVHFLAQLGYFSHSKPCRNVQWRNVFFGVDHVSHLFLLVIKKKISWWPVSITSFFPKRSQQDFEISRYNLLLWESFTVFFRIFDIFSTLHFFSSENKLTTTFKSFVGTNHVLSINRFFSRRSWLFQWSLLGD